MPKEILCVRPGELEWHDYEDARLQADQVRIQVEFAAAKHGTEAASYKGYESARGSFDSLLAVFTPGSGLNPYPKGIGNMVVGRVTEVGGTVTEVKVGDRVMAYGQFRPTEVANELACWKLPDGVPWQSAVCLDPADFALAAVRDANVRVGDAVAIFGMGAIGLVVTTLAKLSGAHPIIAVDPIVVRREAALAVGADLALDPTACDAGVEIKRATANRGADVVIEYSGSRLALQHALRGVAFGGTVVAGAYPAPYGAGLDLGAEAHFNRPNLIFSRACSDPNRDHPRWDNGRLMETAWRLILEGKIDGRPIVSPIVPFEEALDAYHNVFHAPEGSIKLGVRFGG